MTDKITKRPKFQVVSENPEEVIEIHKRWNHRTRQWDQLNCPCGARVIKDKDNGMD